MAQFAIGLMYVTYSKGDRLEIYEWRLKGQVDVAMDTGAALNSQDKKILERKSESQGSLQLEPVLMLPLAARVIQMVALPVTVRLRQRPLDFLQFNLFL